MENFKIEDKQGLEEVRAKAGLEEVKVDQEDKEMQDFKVVEGMQIIQMVKNQENRSIHWIKME